MEQKRHLYLLNKPAGKRGTISYHELYIRISYHPISNTRFENIMKTKIPDNLLFLPELNR
jgi:hypothetical protein